ncbi:hypothetical protein GCM10010347_05200 [Streptomyces cirratus]|uniref:Uncharacterized protein n=1 Tax=Streptomyces cirratus TaxID=68187 RepID=A0ABQ3EKP1_9ACTN|nr:hypothetical protein GCM10010347_05200 [Streptomyces cirratus]
MAGASPEPPNRWDGIQQRQELGDVVSVAARERNGERGSLSVDDQVVLGARTGAVDR